MDVRLPRLGEGADSGTVAAIFVKIGDQVQKDQPLLELESDKAVASIPSPESGTIAAILVKEGDLIRVGQAICQLEEGPIPSKAPPHPREDIVAEPPQRGLDVDPNGKLRDDFHQLSVVENAVDEPAGFGSILPPSGGMPPAASPALRKIARDLGIDLRTVRGSERGGRIVMADLRRHIQRLQQLAAQSSRSAAPIATTGLHLLPTVRPVEAVDFSRWGPIRVEKMSTLRRTISTRMGDAWRAIPHVTQFDEADVTEIMKMRKRLTITPFILTALVKTLKQYPVFNASINEASGEIVYKEYYHLGIAVDTEQGLIVPVIRDVQNKTLTQLATELQELALRTRERKVGLEEMQGGSFTISNQGSIGSGTFTPIINKPEVAILGVARGVEKMVFRKDKFVRRTILPLSLSYDHRVIDGANAARFMVDLVKNIEGFSRIDLGA